MTGAIRFLLNGEACDVTPSSPTETVLDWLRERRGLKGTKEGCAEGDCGACTVVVAEASDDGLAYSAVNACIQFLPSLAGRALWTVDQLADGETLHPVQQAMVDHHGSQCGFCTPGFVMTLFSLYHQAREQAPTTRDIEEALAGNLCRCTGYAPIIRAGRQALVAGRTDRFSEAEAQWLTQLNALDNPSDSFQAANGQPMSVPRDLESLWQQVEAQPEALIVAGATDVGLWVTKGLEDPPGIILTSEVDALRRLAWDEEEQALSIGAAVTYSEAVDAIEALYPSFGPLIRRLGGWQVRNAGTIGGNIANGSPIGDMPPGLIAAEARLVLSSTAGRRTLALEDFFIEYGRQDLRPGEVVERVLLPAPAEGVEFRTWKVSKRFDQDISAICGAFAIRLDAGTVRTARVCFGGMAGTPQRATHCEAALTGNAWTEATVHEAMQAMQEDYAPISDMRASAGYRITVAQNLLWRMYLETTSSAQGVQLTQRYGPGDG